MVCGLCVMTMKRLNALDGVDMLSANWLKELCDRWLSAAW